MSNKMQNPFEIIDGRLSNLENIVLSISHRLPEKDRNTNFINTRNVSIDDMDLTRRQFNAFRCRDLIDSDSIANYGIRKMLDWRNCGPSVVIDTLETLLKMGYGKDIVF